MDDWSLHDRRTHPLGRIVMMWAVTGAICFSLSVIAARQIAVIERQQALAERVAALERLVASCESRLREVEIDHEAAKR